MKHVRCLDAYAVYLMAQRFFVPFAKWCVKSLLGRRPGDLNYFKGFVIGARQSFRFRVDRRTRMYVER
jgi:hypothetical protein